MLFRKENNVPFKWDALNNCIMYCNGQPIGNLVSTNLVLSKDIDSCTQTHNIYSQKEINLIVKNVQWFPQLLNKYSHLMVHGKSFKVRKKHKKTYERLLRIYMNKYLGL